MNREHFETGILDKVEEDKVATATQNKQEVFDAIDEAISFYDIDRIFWSSDKPNTQVYTYSGTPRGSLMAERVDEMMREKFPEQDYEIRIKHGEYSVEITLLGE
jgi:hypothetical protein